MTYTIHALKALKDNYIWVIENGVAAIIVDPTLTSPVVEFLEQQQLKLEAILLTHSHSDHIGGVAELVSLYAPEVIDNFTGGRIEGEIIKLAGFPSLQILLTPGHVYEHVCYLFDDSHLFCGDTLFSLGCGRVFTNDYQLMHQSLSKIKQLKPSIRCYPAHEYTKTNLGFTLSLDAKNPEYYAPLIDKIDGKLASNGNSLPTLLEDELKYNLFLRDNDKNLWQLIEEKSAVKINSNFEYFHQLRLLRNNY
jgi:hydroxyacylglutathione hydrolase